MCVTPLVHLLIAVFNNSAISGAITKCTHGDTHITPRLKFPKISTLAKRDSLVLMFLGISSGGVVYSICTKLNARPVLIIRSIDSAVFDKISSAPSNMDADSMESARQPFRRPCWLPDQ